MNISSMVGYIIFKELDNGDLSVLRIIKCKKYKDKGNPAEVLVKDMTDDTKESYKIRVDELKGYTPLKPDGVIIFNIVCIYDNDGKITRDVLVCGYKYDDIRDKLEKRTNSNQLEFPYVVCRQSITDIFYNIICDGYTNDKVGLSVTKNNCPANFDFKAMVTCNKLESSEIVNIYRDDTIDNVYDMIDLPIYNTALNNMYMRHIKSSLSTNKKPNTAMFGNMHDGWCRDLKTLLSSNYFQLDIEDMFGISRVEFNLEDYFVTKELPGYPEEHIEYTSLSDELTHWLSEEYGYNITNTTVFEYYYDIELDEYKHYMLIRDNTGKLYFITFTVDGKEYIGDLESYLNSPESMSISDKFKFGYMDKTEVAGKK